MAGRANPRSPSPEVHKHKETASSRQRATRTVEQRPSPIDSANEEPSGCRKEAPQCSLMRRNRAETRSVVAIKLSPESRLNAAQQLQIVKMFFAGCSYSAIARQLHRNRRTVTKICTSREIQDTVREMKEKLLAESDAWLESINFAVETEPHGEMAFRLALAFGIIPVIPRPEKKTKPAKQHGWESMDPHQLAVAKVLAMEAQRRAALPPLENDELEKLVREDKVQSERKSRLFANRD
jgi:DNA-binding CsgD family transcriptional regulator